LFDAAGGGDADGKDDRFARFFAGAPLLPRRLTSSELTLRSVEHDDRFVFLTYAVSRR
jgi:hypothetical protein